VQTSAAVAQYPERPIRLLVPLSPGSPPDLITRAVSERLQTLLGQLVVVENRVGATGVIALQALVNQNADGYTLLLLPSPTVAVLSLYPDVRVNFATDIAPIGQIERDYNVLVVGNQSPAKSVAELIALLKQQPGKVNNASGGFGTPAHLIGELFKKETGTSATHFPYTQFPQAVVDVISGRIEFMIMGASVAVPQVQGGKLRALGVTSPARLRSLPDIPTFAELGLGHVSVRQWMGLVARGGTPAPIIDRLNKALNDALDSPEVRKSLETLQSEVVKGTPDDFKAIIAEDVAHWNNAIGEARIKLE